MSQTTPRSSARREDVHFLVLRYLTDHPAASQREISQALGVSLGLINYCLKALIEKGLVKISNFTANDNKLRYAYTLTAKGLSEKLRLTSRFLQRKIKEYEVLKAEIESLQSETDASKDSVYQDNSRPLGFI